MDKCTSYCTAAVDLWPLFWMMVPLRIGAYYITVAICQYKLRSQGKKLLEFKE
jgi:hypothetical protein